MADSLWQRLYRAAHRQRYRWYSDRRRHLPRPVVSVGNLHWGGAGKTPLVAALAAHLRDGGRRVAVLSRGYGRQGRRPRLVSRGDGPELSHRLAGDEPYLLAAELPGVAVAVARRRYDAGRLAMESLDPAPDLFLLDDAFSHLDLARDLDLVVLPVGDPLGGGLLPPGGRLREPLEALCRAHAAILAGPGVDEARLDALRVELAAIGFDRPLFGCPHVSGPARLGDGAGELPAGSRVLLVTGIARPERVVESAGAAGYEVVDHLRFADHHPYPDGSLEEIEAARRRHDVAAVLTTSKDAVKLRGRLAIEVAVLPLVASPSPDFWSWLDGRVEGISAARAGSAPS